MADNVTITEGVGTDIAADVIDDVAYQRVKLTHGADGTATDASAAAPLPVALAASSLPDTAAGDLAAINALAVTIDADTSTLAGAVTGTEVQVDVVTSALPTDAATETKQDATNVLLGTIDADTSILAGAVTTGQMQVDIVAAIPAGTNNIGDVDIASAIPAGTNNIGDVDVLTLPSSVQGPGNPTVDSVASAVVNLAASSADQSLVAAPGADKQIWVYGLFMMADTAAGTMTLQDEDDTALSGTMSVSDEGGWVLPMSGNFAMPWIKVATNKALEADCATSTIDGIICYAIVSV